MNILLVEDDEHKRRKVSEFLHEILPSSAISEARSLQSGLERIISGGHHLIILDMTMPTFDITVGEDGGRPQAYAGRELLNHMKRRGIETPTLVLTQFDRFGEGTDLLTLQELDAQLRKDHPARYVGAIYYNVTDEAWKAELEDAIRRIATMS